MTPTATGILETNSIGVLPNEPITYSHEDHLLIGRNGYATNLMPTGS